MRYDTIFVQNLSITFYSNLFTKNATAPTRPCK